MGIELLLDAVALKNKFDLVVNAMSNKQLLNAIGLRQIRFIDQNFRAEGIEKKWAPLKPSTIARRRRGKKPGRDKILQDTGRLKSSFVHEVQLVRNAVRVGTTVKYAEYHEHGTSRIPMRKMLPSEKVSKDIGTELIKASLKNALVKKAVKKR